MSRSSSSALVLSKVQAAIRLTESLRWNVVDVEIWLHEIEADLQHDSQARTRAALADLDLFGLRVHSTEFEEYRAADDERPEGDCA